MNDLYGRSASVVESQQKLELFISCRGLANMDTFSKSDPFVIIFVKRNNQWAEFGRTEIIQDNLNPNFAKTFIIEYFFECQQPLKFVVNDDDGNGTFDHIGTAETTLANIAGGRDQLQVLDLKNGQKKTGSIVIRVDQVKLINDKIIMQIRANNLPDTKFGFWHTTSPFLRLYRLRKDTNQQLLIYESEPIKNNRSPTWKRIDIAAQKLCNGDYFMPIKMEVWDYRSSGEHEKLAELDISVDELRNKGQVTRQLLDKHRKQAGQLIFSEFKLIEKPGFIEYLQSGTQINLIAAVDFTASNQAPNNPNSLHYIDPYQKKMNQYQSALLAVGDILLCYDHDKKVPLYGFGCKPRLPYLQSNQTLHCFPLNGNPEDPEVFQMDGIMQTYYNAVRNVQFDGPTYFNPIIQESMKIAQMCKDMASDTYFVLLILTDGEIHDMQPTINSIVAASHLPLSIIIVGVGNADFTNMNTLDDDDGNLIDDRGRRTQRDLVQFVPFNQFRDNPELLAKNVLQELPDQLVDYMLLTGKKPGPKKVINLNMFDINQYQQPPPPTQQGSFNQLPVQSQQYPQAPIPQVPIPQVPQPYQMQQQYPIQQPQQSQNRFIQGLANANFLGQHINQAQQYDDAQYQQMQQQQPQFGAYQQPPPPQQGQYPYQGYPSQGQFVQPGYNYQQPPPYQPPHSQ